LFFIIFRVLSNLFKNWLGKNSESRLKNSGNIKKSKYQNIEEAKYTEIKTDDDKKN
jgi:hypothetical protein